MSAHEAPRRRLTAQQRREQLIEVARSVFAVKGYEAATVEEIAERAGVTKPVVYQHFGGKEGLYAVVVDREVAAPPPRAAGEQAAAGFLTYIEEHADGFRVLVHDTPVGASPGGIATVIGDVAVAVEQLWAKEFADRGLDPVTAPMYARMLVGAVALVGEWWLETGEPSRDVVAAHVVNLMWNGLRGLERSPWPGEGRD